MLLLSYMQNSIASNTPNAATALVSSTVSSSLLAASSIKKLDLSWCNPTYKIVFWPEEQADGANGPVIAFRVKGTFTKKINESSSGWAVVPSKCRESGVMFCTFAPSDGGLIESYVCSEATVEALMKHAGEVLGNHIKITGEQSGEIDVGVG